MKEAVRDYIERQVEKIYVESMRLRGDTTSTMDEFQGLDDGVKHALEKMDDFVGIIVEPVKGGKYSGKYLYCLKLNAPEHVDVILGEMEGLGMGKNVKELSRHTLVAANKHGRTIALWLASEDHPSPVEIDEKKLNRLVGLKQR